MSEQTPPERGVESRLASMERRLAEIQHELAPEAPERRAPPPPAAGPPPPAAGPPPPAAGPPPPAAGPPPPAAGPPPPAAGPPPRAPAPPAADDPELLGGLYVNLLASARRLVDGYEAALRELRGLAPPTEEVAVSAGPFESTSSLRDFERELAALPGVREVAVRGYQAGDRAILEVQLEPETT